MVEHLARDLWPAVKERLLPAIHEPADLAALDAFIPERPFPNSLSDNASRAALELAILDCALRRDGRGAAALLPPRRDKVVYSGVITAGTIEKALPSMTCAKSASRSLTLSASCCNRSSGFSARFIARASLVMR